MEKYILYARKSTDAEDRQVLSIEAQLAELRKYAKDNDLSIIDELVEKRTAKMPGRPVFNDMLTRIADGEANGILAWHPDRLARNSIDGGQIVYLLDQTTINYLRFPMFQFENTSQDKFMLSIMFSQSKYYIDNLAENVKRGLRQKVRRGEMPGLAPLGYINDVRTKTIVKDKRIAPIIADTFALYAHGDKTMSEVADFLFEKGVKTDGKYYKRNGKTSAGGKRLKDDRMKKILQNPFYYGHFVYHGETHEGVHAPIISKVLFDKVQSVMQQRSHTQPETKQNIPFLGLLKCPCGMSITAETKTKTQKNGNHHAWTYYRCSRKNKAAKCIEPAVRENSLLPQLSALLDEFSLSEKAISWLDDRLTADEAADQNKDVTVVKGLRGDIEDLNGRQKRLLDSYLDQDIDRQTFVGKKNEIVSKKRTIEERLAQIERNRNAWVEPMRAWLKEIGSICKSIETNDYARQKVLLAKIFGSNLFLRSKTIVALGDAPKKSPLKTPWLALRAANKKAAHAGDSLEFFSEMATLYEKVRTYFEQNA